MVMAGMLRGSGVFCFCKDNRQLTGFPPAADVVYTGCLLGGVHDLDATILGPAILARRGAGRALFRSEEHTSELQSLMRISYAVFCLKKKKKYTPQINK